MPREGRQSHAANPPNTAAGLYPAVPRSFTIRRMSFSRIGLEAVRRHRLLERVTLAYLASPFLAFAAGWLKPIVAVMCISVTLAGIYVAQRRRPDEEASGDFGPVDSHRVFVTYGFTLAAVIVVVVFSGTGDYAPALGGHYRNVAFVYDMMHFPWPLGFESPDGGEPFVLTFYIGNAILPALVGWLLGWGAAFHFQFVWTCLGVFLAACWFLRIVGRISAWYVLLFLLFGGLDLLAHWIFLGWYSWAGNPPDLWMVPYAMGHPEMGFTFWILPSNLTILYRSPHHILASTLACLMIVDDVVHRGTCRRAGLVSAFCLLWSALSFVGLAPFVLLALVATRGRGMLSFENTVAGVVVLGVTALYVGSNNGEFLHGWLWSFQNPLDTWPILLSVYVLEFGIFAALITLAKPERSGVGHPMWLWTAVACLLLTPWYRLGSYSDFTTKASLPALLVLQLCVAHAVATSRQERRTWVGALIAVLVFGSASALALIRVGIGAGLDADPPRAGLARKQLSKARGVGQLYSSGEGFFWDVLAKPVVFQPAPRLRPRRKAR